MYQYEIRKTFKKKTFYLMERLTEQFELYIMALNFNPSQADCNVLCRQCTLVSPDNKYVHP